MFHRKSAVPAALSVLAICIVVTSFLSACSGSGGGTQNSGNIIDPDTMPPGTGGITFRVVWQPSSSGSNSKVLMAAAFNSCIDYGIDTISATVLSGATTVTSISWPCALHKGIVPGIPAGSNYTLKVEGKSSGTTLWSGSNSPISVDTGQVTNAGTIAMSYIGGDLSNPTVSLMGPNSSPTSTTNVPVTDRMKIVFSEPMMISTVTSTNITLNSGSVQGSVSYDGASNTAAFIPSANLDHDAQYVLQVQSCVTDSCIKDTAGNQLTSNYTFTFTTEAMPTGMANQPAGLTTKAGNGQVTLDWPAVSGATSYNVYYGTTSGVTTTTGTTLSDVQTPSVHLELTNGTTYYYIVTAANSYGESASMETSATPTVPAGNNPAAPASLAVTYDSGSGGPNTITWPTVSGLSYNLYWSTTPVYPDHNQAENVIRYVTGGQYIHNSVTSGVTYCYILTAMNSAGESADSKQVCGPGAGTMMFLWE